MIKRIWYWITSKLFKRKSYPALSMNNLHHAQKQYNIAKARFQIAKAKLLRAYEEELNHEKMV